MTNAVIQDLCIGQSYHHQLSVNRTAVTHIRVSFAVKQLPELEELNCDYETDIIKI